MTADLRSIALWLLAALVVAFGLTAWQYKRMYKATDFALTTQNNAIKQQNETANRRLVQLTNERDAKQALLDQRAEAQEKTDATALAQINEDDRRQRSAPVRVSVHNCARDAGSGGGRPAGETPPAAQAGAGDTSPASGVLSDAAARRFADAVKEIEGMSAAYASCRADLIPGP